MKYKLTQQAKELSNLYDFTPKQGTPHSSGYDLSACLLNPIKLFPSEEVKIGTGVHIWIGSDCNAEAEDIGKEIKVAGFLMPRSSIKGCMLTNAVGLCDADYQGEYIVSLFNRTEEAIVIMPGQKLVQLVFVFTYLPTLECVEEFDTNTLRGTGGFGSTGG